MKIWDSVYIYTKRRILISSSTCKFSSQTCMFSSRANTIIASLLRQEGKQGIYSKAVAIKCCKEIKITALSNECRNIPLFAFFERDRACLSLNFVKTFPRTFFEARFWNPHLAKLWVSFIAPNIYFKTACHPYLLSQR